MKKYKRKSLGPKFYEKGCVSVRQVYYKTVLNLQTEKYKDCIFYKCDLLQISENCTFEGCTFQGCRLRPWAELYKGGCKGINCTVVPLPPFEEETLVYPGFTPLGTQVFPDTRKNDRTIVIGKRIL